MTLTLKYNITFLGIALEVVSHWWQLYSFLSSWSTESAHMFMQKMLECVILHHHWPSEAEGAQSYQPQSCKHHPLKGSRRTSLRGKGSSIGIIYLDFSKAFDMAPHNILLSKLEKHGFDGWAVEWTKNWLQGGVQRVVVNGSVSGRKWVMSGVPQRSVLGWILFIIFISDIWASVYPFWPWICSFCAWNNFELRIRGNGFSKRAKHIQDQHIRWTWDA